MTNDARSCLEQIQMSRILTTFTFFFLILPIYRLLINFHFLLSYPPNLAGGEQQGVNEGEGDQFCWERIILCHCWQQASNIMLRFFCLCASFTHIFNRIHPILWIGMWSSGTWSTQEVPNTRSQYLWWAGTILLFILNIILYDHDYHQYYLNFSRPHQNYYFAALPGRPFLASRGTTISVMWLAVGERWWVHFTCDIIFSTIL